MKQEEDNSVRGGSENSRSDARLSSFGLENALCRRRLLDRSLPIYGTTHQDAQSTDTIDVGLQTILPGPKNNF
jgi:hypothetical protein